MNKVALYCRVSTLDQTNETQLLRLKEYADKNGVQYDIYQEQESSRKTRPVKQELMARLRAGDYEAVVVWKLDRFARSSHELIMDISELVKKNVGFISLTDNLDFSTATGRLHFQILAAFAEFERALISERTREALRAKKQAGKCLGRPKGAKDTKARPKSGYLMREIKKRKAKDEQRGIYLPDENYVAKNPPPKNKTAKNAA